MFFQKYLDAGIKSTLNRHGDFTTLGEVVDSLEDREGLQRDVGRLEIWVTTNH